MNSRIERIGRSHILYDADLAGQVEPGWFAPNYWAAHRALTGQARGRGTAWFVRHGQLELVLRRYRRGGMLAPLWRDRYPWLGLRHTRAWREWLLLAALWELGLPVPRPVAARVTRTRLLYTAEIITQRLPTTRSLAERLTEAPLDGARWQAIGATLRRFHAAGVYHADLNAHNILLDAEQQVHLIDFDRGALRPPGRWQRANLARLHRSLRKLRAQRPGFAFQGRDWRALLQGYEAAPG